VRVTEVPPIVRVVYELEESQKAVRSETPMPVQWMGTTCPLAQGAFESRGIDAVIIGKARCGSEIVMD
jgi:hypothetical protein